MFFLWWVSLVFFFQKSKHWRVRVVSGQMVCWLRVNEVTRRHTAGMQTMPSAQLAMVAIVAHEARALCIDQVALLPPRVHAQHVLAAFKKVTYAKKIMRNYFRGDFDKFA